MYVIELVVSPQVVKVWTKTWVIMTIVKENVRDKQTHKQTNSYFINIDFKIILDFLEKRMRRILDKSWERLLGFMIKRKMDSSQSRLLRSSFATRRLNCQMVDWFLNKPNYRLLSKMMKIQHYKLISHKQKLFK